MPRAREVQFNGQTVRLPDLCARFGMRVDTVTYRLRQGWPLEDALKVPSQRARPAAAANGAAPSNLPPMPPLRQVTGGAASPELAPPAPRIEPVPTAKVLPRGGAALLEEARQIMQRVEYLLAAPECLDLHRPALLLRLKSWNQRAGGAA